MPQLKFYNTLTKKIEDFKPIKSISSIYACGPTVYNYAHLGNLRSYITWDILIRILKYNNYKTNFVMNITDVGHLTDDADQGEDKMEKGAIRENKSAADIAKFYTNAFVKNLSDLNIVNPDIFCKATEHIPEQIKLVEKLESKNFTYKTTDGIYFDTSKLKNYGQLANLQNQNLQAGKRVDTGEKKNPTDFALWKFSPKNSTRQMEWESPWGIGFPGWHLECSAMSAKYLGLPFDIHCGGIDHIPVHHTNEIAQTQAAEGIIPAHFWMHNEFLNMGSEKMAKSVGNFITLETLIEKNINPIAYRYFLLQTHYRKQMNFNWDALKAAEKGLEHLYKLAKKLSVKKDSDYDQIKLKKEFNDIINNDIDTPGTLAFIWTALKDNTIELNTLLKFDEVLGLDIKSNLITEKQSIPEDIKEIIKKRDAARKNKDWGKSDELRDKLIAAGYDVVDTGSGTQVNK